MKNSKVKNRLKKNPPTLQDKGKGTRQRNKSIEQRINTLELMQKVGKGINPRIPPIYLEIPIKISKLTPFFI